MGRSVDPSFSGSRGFILPAWSDLQLIFISFPFISDILSNILPQDLPSDFFIMPLAAIGRLYDQST